MGEGDNGLSRSYRQLVRLGVHLIESDQDLTELKNVIDGLGEVEAKEMLTVSAASDAYDYLEMSRRANLN